MGGGCDDFGMPGPNEIWDIVLRHNQYGSYRLQDWRTVAPYDVDWFYKIVQKVYSIANWRWRAVVSILACPAPTEFEVLYQDTTNMKATALTIDVQ
jgi:hypothetical protein